VKAQKFIPLVVVAAGLLAYHNSFTGPFIFDDAQSIVENPTIRHLWPISDVLAPPRRGGITVEGRPIINLSLAINYALGGLNVWGYHAFNLAIHILSGLTLLGIVRRTLLQPRFRQRFGAVATELALAVAVLWTVHPLTTEAVTYIVQRAESIMGLFYLLTLYCFIRGTESPRTAWWYELSLGACILGMASKEVMASAPLIVMLYDRTFVSGSFRDAWRRHRSVYQALACTWILLGCLVFFTGSYGNAATNAQIKGVTAWRYLLAEPGVMLHYLRLSVWPHPLCFDYSDWPLGGTGLGNLLPILVIVVLLVAIALAMMANSAGGFLGAWFFLILAPSSSFIPTDSPAYEHRMYLPLAAVVVLVVFGIYTLLGRRSLPVFLGLAIGLGFLTTQRNEDYRSKISIWSDAVAKRPGNARAHYNFGRAFSAAGRLPEAVEQYEQAIRIRPDYSQAHNNLGFILYARGEVQPAIAHFERALQINPYDPEAHNNLGVALSRVGRNQEAIAQYEQALQIRPDYPEVRNNLARLLEAQANGTVP